MLAVGSRSPGSSKTEGYLIEDGQWKTIEDYPFAWESKVIFANFDFFLIHNKGLVNFGMYAALYHNSVFYIFGGITNLRADFSQTIAQLDTKTSTWSKVGNLKNGRWGHSAIFDGENFLIIGGWKNYDSDPVNNEICTLKNSTMTCVEQSTTLKMYFPELFLVAKNFGKDQDKC